MELVELLQTRQAAIIFDATESLDKARLRHYQQSTSAENGQRHAELFDLALQCVHSKNLIPVIAFSQNLARQRFHQGFDLAEVQTAYHVLEETLWRHITDDVPPGRAAIGHRPDQHSSRCGKGRPGPGIRFTRLETAIAHTRPVGIVSGHMREEDRECTRIDANRENSSPFAFIGVDSRFSFVLRAT